MNVQAAVQATITGSKGLFSSPKRRRLSYLLLLAAVAALDYGFTWRSTRTFTFYSVLDGKPRVERRYLPRSLNEEVALSRYVSELLLGPSEVDSGMLFSKGAYLKAVMVRNGTAYIDLSRDAAIPVDSKPDARLAISSAISDIRRNFPLIKHASIYIEGHEPYASDVTAVPPKGESPKNGKSVDK